VAETLALCHPLEDRTMLDGVTHVPASRALLISEHGLTFEPRRDAWSSPPARANWTLEESADALEEALDSAVAAWTGAEARINIALTGGIDTRLLLTFANPRGPHLEASTFGEIESVEVKVARELCRLTDTAHGTCELSAGESVSSEELSRFAIETEWVSDAAGPFYWRRWLSFLAEREAPMVSGYVGDILAGHRARLPGVPRRKFFLSALDARDDVAADAASQGRVFARFARDGSREDFSLQLGARMADAYTRLPGESVLERMIALHLSLRQRRYASWFSNVCDRAVPSLHPFLSRAVVDAFARMPLSSRFDRAAVHTLLRRRMPQALLLIDSNTGRRAVQASRWDWWRDAALHNPYSRRLAAFLGKPDRLVLSTFHALVRAHRLQIVEELERPNLALDELLDLRSISAAVRDGRGVALYPQMRLFNVAAFTRGFYG
jgi:hypothetical protein